MREFGLAVAAGSTVLAGCATASFSPPSTNIVNEMEVRGSNFSFAKRCKPEERSEGGQVVPISRDANGAIVLTNNFIYEYRCAAHSTGNSRQAFEVPGLLAGIGTATAVAFGAGSDVALAGGAATVIADGGKDYYAPLQKAAIYDSSLDALLCIKSVATGTKPFTEGADASQKRLGHEELDATTGFFSAERQFFEMVSAALFTVERIAASRLRTSAQYDPAGVIAQIKQLSDEVDEKGGDPSSPGGSGTEGTRPEPSGEQKAAATQIVEEQQPQLVGIQKETKIKAVAAAIRELDVMQPQLQLCIVRAKL